MGTDFQTRTLLFLLQGQIETFEEQPRQEAAHRFLAAKDGVAVELVPVPTSPLTNEVALGAIESIRSLITKCGESKGFWGLLKCGGTPVGDIKIEFDMESEPSSSGPETA
ncbi:hypothetical protein ACLMJK_001174 [Lecanora helva]